MFRVRSLQVEHGDSVLVSYANLGRFHHLLVDGGPAKSRDTLVAVLEEVRKNEGDDGKLLLEALVVTHYDLDHIQGVIELLQKKPDWLEIGDIWFNGFNHLQPSDKLGPAQGDELSGLIKELDLPWNVSFTSARAGNAKRVIHQGVEKVKLPGGLEVHVLSPDVAGLRALGNVWRHPQSPPPDGRPVATDRLGWKDAWPPKAYPEYTIKRFLVDQSIPNQSSIALLLSLGEKRVLLAADALPSTIINGLRFHLRDQPPIDLLKVSHHGSKRNTNRDLLDRIRCQRFLISTSGAKHNHPDIDLIGLILARVKDPEISFNYGEGYWPGKWAKKPQSWRFTARYPQDGRPYVDVELGQGSLPLIG